MSRRSGKALLALAETEPGESARLNYSTCAVAGWPIIEGLIWIFSYL